MSAVTLSAAAGPNVHTLTDRSKKKLLTIDSNEFGANFNRQPFFIEHSLGNHPLFSLPRLVELSRVLPKEHVIYHSGEIEPNVPLYGGRKTGLSSEETIRQIEECKSWLVLRYVETDPEYRDLINAVLDEVQVYTEPLDPGMLKRQAFIFITSPLGVTPWHTDPEYSFLFQIRGNKKLKIVSPPPFSEEEVESYFATGRNPEFKDEYYERASTYDLTAGRALHFPLTVPHWVHNGNEVAISISITFQTYASERRTIIYNTNHRLRRRGLQPTPYGKSVARDSAKFFAFRASRRARKLLHLPEKSIYNGYKA